MRQDDLLAPSASENPAPIAIDIGGANVKAASADGRALSVPFPLWKTPEDLSALLRDVLQRLEPWTSLAVTMTGELCDGYGSRREGVIRILDSVERALGSGHDFWVWTLDRQLLSHSHAARSPEKVGAANWLALAEWCARTIAENAVLIDMGSTTTDFVILQGGGAAPLGLTDFERLRSGELIYSGVRRTPLCAIRQDATLHGGTVRLAAELFATTDDVGLILEDRPDDPTSRNTADGRERTRERACERMARMVCMDASELAPENFIDLARQFRDAQMRGLEAGLLQTLEAGYPPASSSPHPDLAIISGSGEFLARQLAERAGFDEIVSLASSTSLAISDAACAYALARLLQDREG